MRSKTHAFNKRWEVGQPRSKSQVMLWIYDDIKGEFITGVYHTTS